MPSRRLFSRIFYSFPVQLVLMHFKKNQLMMLYWIILAGFITESLATRFGIPFLFLDPEYMGKVGKRSFFIVGLGMGAFIMAFNISSFILNSFRFPFLATLSRTFQKYAYNNFIIPLSFVLIYCYRLFEFQQSRQLAGPSTIAIDLLMFLLGIGLVIFLTLRYFTYTNKDIYKLFGVESGDLDTRSPVKATARNEKGKAWRVDTYITAPFRVKLVRDTRHYRNYMLEQVFRQNHLNAAVMEMVVFVTFIVLGLFRDYSVFRIPAAASVLLLFTMIIMLSGVLRYWLRAWANTAIVLLFLLFNFLSGFEVFNPRNQAYGLNYNSVQEPYDLENLASHTDSLKIEADRQHTIGILERWKAKWKTRGVEKPKIVLLTSSGGGLRSCVFTFRSLQVLDSIYRGDLMNHTAFISGSSGGMISTCYYRELFLTNNQELQQANQNLDNPFLKNIGKDLLNSVAFSATVADLFLNMQTFKDGPYRYVKDRAWAWENQLNENTGNAFQKRIRDYYIPEMEARIPLTVITPTIINDGRALHISSQPVSYLLHNSDPGRSPYHEVSNGIEFSEFFKDQNAQNLRLSSALRMNSSFPYIMPPVSLPSEPAIEVMDAGIRDNYGVINSIQFLYAFREWIETNTSGVIFLQIRDTWKKPAIEDNSIKTIVEKISAPMRNLSGNFIVMQDYNFDRMLQYSRSWYNGPLDFIILQMPESEERAALSWHLTEKEKQLLRSSALSPGNRKELEKLQRILPPSSGVNPPGPF